MPERKISHRSLAMRIEALRRRHRELDDKVSREQVRSWSDPSLMKRLKQERLHLRDAIRGAQALLTRAGSRPRQAAI